MMEKLETHWKPAMMAFCQNDQICGISNVIDVGLEIQLIFFLLETCREEVSADSWWVSGRSPAATSLTDHRVPYSY